MNQANHIAKHHHRTIWLSDIHLGCRDCKAEFLLNFLHDNSADRIFLVGDIVDFWALQRRVYWPNSHNQILNLLLQRAQDGVEVIYLPGNHDEVMKPYVAQLFGNIQIHSEYVHTTVTGKTLLMLHGDKYDSEVCFGKFHAKLGDVLYDFLLWMNRQCHGLRKLFGLPYWSMASYIKTKVKKANEAIRRYRNAAIADAKTQGVDGIVCGHIHHPQMEMVDGTLYCNDGDWIENCTTMVESQSGNLKLLRWQDGQNQTQVISQMNWGERVAQLDEAAA